jgi:hypothetical protein
MPVAHDMTACHGLDIMQGAAVIVPPSHESSAIPQSLWLSVSAAAMCSVSLSMMAAEGR